MNDEQLHAMRHSLAHIMAAAVQRLYPEAKFGVGPVVENGFYYDIDGGRQLMQKLMHEQLSIELRLARTFRPKFLPDGDVITPTKPRMNRSYVLDESYKGF